MSNLGVSLNVLNQKGSPALYQDLFANIPAPGYTGRLFVSTDSLNLYRDNGSAWVQVAGSSGGSGVSSITGTANQVIASASTGAVTLSLPQNINVGASPTFAGVTLSGLSAAGIVINNGSGVLATTTGTGFVKIAAGVVSYDNSTYLTTAGASGIYQPIISLTTTGASGAATFAGNILNVPAYTLAGLGGISLTALSASSPLIYNSGTGAFTIQAATTSQAGYLTQTDWNTFNSKQAQINGTGFVKATGTTISFDNSTYITLASLSASSPLIYNSGTGAFSIQAATTSQAGYLTQTDWNTFNSKQSTITLTTTGASGAASLVSNTLNVPAYTLIGLGGITLASLSASSPLIYNSGTGAFSIQAATTSQAGYLTNSDWNTFNNKQAQINGTGFVKATGTTISFDNSVYLTTAVAASTYLPLTGGTLTGALIGTSVSMSGSIVANAPSTIQGDASNGGTLNLGNTALYRGVISYTGAINSTLSITNTYDNAAAAINFVLRSTGTPIMALSLFGSGAATFIGNVTANSCTSIVNGADGFFVQPATGTQYATIRFNNGGGNLWVGIDNSTGSNFGGSGYDANLYYSGSHNMNFWTNGVKQLSIASTGISTFTTTVNVSTDITLNAVNGMITSSALSPAGFNYSSSTALNSPAFFYGYTGSGGATFTVPNPSLNNQWFYIRNTGSGTLTVAAFSGYNIFTTAGATVASVTLLAGIGSLFYSNGASLTLQMF